MAGSTFGTLFKVTTWGESHGPGIGVVVDGCPAGLALEEADIQKYLDRRKPGQNRFTTARQEADRVQILSGVFEGRTTGTPISLVVMNTDQRSRDYSNIAHTYRPGHADFCFDQKYGFRDYRGGGRSSARETIGRVAAGAIAAKLLGELGIELLSYVSAVGPVEITGETQDRIERTLSMGEAGGTCCDGTLSKGTHGEGVHGEEASSGKTPHNEAHDKETCCKKSHSAEMNSEVDLTRLREQIAASPLYMPDPEAEQAATAYLEKCLEAQDSSGGAVSCRVTGLMPGIGEPVFDKLDALLGQALFSIGAVKAVEIGDGCAVSRRRGSENNDQYDTDANGAAQGAVRKSSNHGGGIYGGISDGSALSLRVHFKPTPSIARPQQALADDGSVKELVIKGRHDPVIVPRAVVVVESMVAITLLDLILRNMTATVDGIRHFYR